MDDSQTPIFAHTYALAKRLYELRITVPKQDRYALWQRCESAVLEILECVVLASRLPRDERQGPLRTASSRLDLLRVLVRLAKDTRAINLKQYAGLQEQIDEIGRMLGGWMKASARSG